MTAETGFRERGIMIKEAKSLTDSLANSKYIPIFTALLILRYVKLIIKQIGYATTESIRH